MKIPIRAALVIALLASPTFALEDEPIVAAPTPTPTVVSAYDRLVQDIDRVNAQLQRRDLTAGKRAHLTKAKRDLEAQKLKMDRERTHQPAAPAPAKVK